MVKTTIQKKTLSSNLTRSLEANEDRVIRAKYGLSIDEKEALPRISNDAIKTELTNLEAIAYQNVYGENTKVDQNIKSKIISKLKSKV